MPGTLFVVATPIGNLDDISPRALRALAAATVIAAEDTRRTAHLLARYAISTPTVSLHEHNESRKTSLLLERLARGEDVALVSDAGTPAISDPGHRLVRAALDARVRVESIPGPSAITAALAASGFSSDTFLFLGFPPTRSHDRIDWFEELRTARRTVVFFEAPHRIKETLQQLQILLGDRRVAICRELTKAHEELVIGQINQIINDLKKHIGEFTVVVEAAPPALDEPPAVSDAQIVKEFGEMTISMRISRRKAVAMVARRHGRSPNDVYEVIERIRKLVK